MFLSLVSNYDMTLYLLCAELLPAWYLLTVNSVDYSILMGRIIQVWLAISLSLFWLVWGGFSVDSWQYLMNFDINPLTWNKEHLFWALGVGLAQILPDPWPLKVISLLISALLFWAYYKVSCLGSNSVHKFIVAMFLLLVMPGYFLLTGNVVRQGMAAAIILLGVSFLLSKQRMWGIILILMALFFHLMSFVFAVSFIAKRIRTYVVILLLISPLASFILIQVLSLFQVDLFELIPYAGKVEGSFYYAKFIIANALAYVFLWIYFKAEKCNNFLFVSSYVWIVIFSNLFLAYEVPFERLLLFSNVVLPLALLEVMPFTRINLLSCHHWIKSIVVGLVLLTGSLVWSHHSTQISLGYG